MTNLLAQASERIARSSPQTKEARELLERLAILGRRDGFTLTHALSIAAERFDHDAATFDQQKLASEAIKRADPDAVQFFSPVAAEQLAKQFRQQAADVRELIDAIEGNEPGETWNVWAARDGETYRGTVEADGEEEARAAARPLIAEALQLEEQLEGALGDDDLIAFDAELDGFTVELA